MTLPILRSTLLGLLCISAALAEPPEDAKDFMKHLKKEGYTCEKGDAFVKATHSSQLDLVLKAYKDGVLVQSFAASNVKEREDIIDTVNKLNANATTTKFYIDGDGDTMIEAWYPGRYKKDTFTIFLEAWQGDTKGQITAISLLIE